jgi:ArsR family transcriptional regulator, arsenate/arsenite/antimonite-responsive transcriptional repressor
MITKKAEFAVLEQDVAEIAKALSHPARITILKILAGLDGCMCGDIVQQLPLAQSTVSQHLKSLKEAGLIKGEVDGPKVCYCIDADALLAFKANIDTIFDQIHTIRKNSGCC